MPLCRGYAIALFFLSLGSISIHVLLQDAKKEKAQKELEVAKKIVFLISKKYGKTTLAELMMRMDIALPELKAKLNELQKEGIVGIEVSQTG